MGENVNVEVDSVGSGCSGSLLTSDDKFKIMGQYFCDNCRLMERGFLLVRVLSTGVVIASLCTGAAMGMMYRLSALDFVMLVCFLGISDVYVSWRYGKWYTSESFSDLKRYDWYKEKVEIAGDSKICVGLKRTLHCYLVVIAGENEIPMIVRVPEEYCLCDWNLYDWYLCRKKDACYSSGDGRLFLLREEKKESVAESVAS